MVGTRYLDSIGWDARVVSLVALHSSARLEHLRLRPWAHMLDSKGITPPPRAAPLPDRPVPSSAGALCTGFETHPKGQIPKPHAG
jgi:hypothetical protein